VNILIIPPNDLINNEIPNRLYHLARHWQHHTLYLLRYPHYPTSINIERPLRRIDIVPDAKPAGNPATYYLKNARAIHQALKKAIQREPIDIVIHANILPSLYAVRLAKAYRKRAVFDYLDHYPESAAAYFKNRVAKWAVYTTVALITTYNLKNSHKIVTVSHTLKQLLEKRAKGPIYLLPNGVDTELFKPMPREQARRQLEQTAKIMISLEREIVTRKPRAVVSLGDTNTTLAAALAASKTNTPFIHLEAGMRSWDKTMPEEINRIIADHVADVLIAFTQLAKIYLAHEGIPLDKIYVTGSTEVDVIYKYKDEIEKKGKEMLNTLDLNPGEYTLATVHRAGNVDNPDTLREILAALNEISKRYKVVIPLHPRTRNAIKTYGLDHMLNTRNIYALPPLGYFEFLGLLKYAKAVLTDSGGVQVDACTLDVPMIVLRYSTEYPECIVIGLAKLAGTKSRDILTAFNNATDKRIYDVNPLGDGKAGEKIAGLLRTIDIRIEAPDLRNTPLILYAITTKPSNDNNIIVCYDQQGYPSDENKHLCLVRKRLTSFFTKT